jgi:hypothetical protein
MPRAAAKSALNRPTAPELGKRLADRPSVT